MERKAKERTAALEAKLRDYYMSGGNNLSFHESLEAMGGYGLPNSTRDRISGEVAAYKQSMNGRANDATLDVVLALTPLKVGPVLKGLGVGGRVAAERTGLSVAERVGVNEAATVARPKGVPSNWTEMAGNKSGHTKWVNPDNVHDYVRLKPDGSVTQVRNGKAYDVGGNRVDTDSKAAHNISIFDFIFRE